MTPAFFPSHCAVPLTPPGQTMDSGTARPDSAQRMKESTGAEEIESKTQVSTQQTTPARIRVLVVDDHEVVRKGICTVLNEENDFEVAGQAGTGNHAITLGIQLQPDIILLDILLGASNGLDIAQQLMRACPESRIVIFTGFTDEGHLFRAMRIGVHGYLQKSLSLDELLAALRAIYRGERVIGEPRAITQVLSEFSRLTKEQERIRSGLSDIEIELVRLASAGCSNKEIAARQFWSEVTVKRKMQDIYRKLQVTDRAQAVAEAMRMGLI